MQITPISLVTVRKKMVLPATCTLYKQRHMDLLPGRSLRLPAVQMFVGSIADVLGKHFPLFARMNLSTSVSFFGGIVNQASESGSLTWEG
jgi:hypothetical protein